MKNSKAPFELVRNKFNVPPATLHKHWSSDNLQQYRDFVSHWDTAKDLTDLTRYVACSLSLKRRGHKPFLSHQDEVAPAAWVVHQAQFGLAITKDQLAAEACKMA
jgi:hypothetical protein